MTFGPRIYGSVGLALGASFGLGALAARGALLPASVCAVVTCALAFLVGRQTERSIARPIRTAASVVDAIRHGDYTHRARVEAAHGPVVELLGEINDLALHLANERMRAKEATALLQSVVQRVDVALLAFDDEGALLWWNPAAERLVGSGLTAGATASRLGVGDWLVGAPERAVSVPGHPGSTWELQRGVFRREGRQYQYLLLTSLRRVRREEERAAWVRLLRVIGHEVNNTLAPIQSMAATCSANLRDEGAAAVGDVQRALDVIEQRSASLGRFIAEYARLARLPAPKVTQLELGEHVRRVAAMDPRCPIELVGARDVTVFADGPLLEQALVNLVRNAVDATLMNENQSQNPNPRKVTIDWRVEGSDAVVTIVDSGPGIESSENLFVPLFSTKPGGSGIGLVLSRNIIEAHGGEVRLSNRVREAGCIARVTIPLERPEAEALAQLR